MISFAATRPLSLARIYANSLLLYVRSYLRFVPLLLAYQVAGGLISLLTSALVRPLSALNWSEIEYTDLQPGAGAGEAGWLCACCLGLPPLILLSVVVTTLGEGALVRAADLCCRAQSVKPLELAGFVARRLAVLLGVTLLSAFAVGLAFVTVIGIPVAMYLAVRWSFIYQAVVIEGSTGGGAFARSRELVRGSWWRVAAMSLALVVTVVVLSLAVSYPVGAVLVTVETLFSDDWWLSEAVSIVGTSVPALLLGGLYAVGMTALYYDQLQRKEAQTATLRDEAPLLA